MLGAPLIDRFGRKIESMRISVTDRCDLRCFYCIPGEEIEWLPREELLTLEEMARLSRIAAECGVSKLRITGGEPLLRRNLDALIRSLAAIEGIASLALTTNATSLAKRADSLYAAGLERVNISLDSLRPETFFRLARRDRLDQVLEGIDAAAAAGMKPIRINTVPIRGINDDEILDFVEMARERDFECRFIEFMPLERGATWGPDRMIPGAELRERISKVHAIVADPDIHPSQPSRDYRFADGAPGKVGFIDAVTQPFCRQCNRIRLTADGKIRTCLFSIDEIDLIGPLRAGASDEDLAAIFHAAVARKEQKHHISDGLFIKPDRTMSAIGG
jgi:cyclic pyranopterin phosphate synthase